MCIENELRNALDNVLSDFKNLQENSKNDSIEPFDENGRVQKFNRSSVETVSRDLFAEFRKLAKEKYGLNIKIGSIRYTDVNFSCKFDFNITSKNGYRKPSSIELKELNRNAYGDSLIDENESIYGKKYVMKKDSKILTIVGYNSRKKKQPYIVMVNKNAIGYCNHLFLKNQCTPIEDIESI